MECAWCTAVVAAAAAAAACRCGWPPLVQADGTKSIMYKDVKRNGSKMPDGVRMNGEGGGGVAGDRRRRGTMGYARRWWKDQKEGWESRG